MEVLSLIKIGVVALIIVATLIVLWKYGKARYRDGYQKGREDVKKEWEAKRLVVFQEMRRKLEDEGHQVIPTRRKGSIKEDGS